MLPANFRVDAWYPAAYTGKPPIILAGIIRRAARAADAASEPVAVPAGDSRRARERQAAPRRVRQRRRDRRQRGDARRERHRGASFQDRRRRDRDARGVGDDLTWAFNAIPDKPRTVALTKDPEQQNRGSLLLSYRVEDDYGAPRRTRRLPARRRPGVKATADARCMGRRFRAGPAAGAHQEQRRSDHQGRDRPSVGRRRGGAPFGSGVVGYSFVEYLDLLPVMSFYE